MNEIDLLARMRADLPEDPEALARARARLMQSATDGGRPSQTPERQVPRRWAWPLAGVGGLAAAGLVVAVVIGGTAPVPPAPGPSAGVVSGTQNVLLVAAERVEKAAPASGRYWVSRSESGTVSLVGPADNRYQVVQRGRAETWIAQDPHQPSWWLSRSLGAKPLTPADVAAWKRDGEPDSWTTSVPGRPGALEIPAAAGAPFGNPINAGADVLALGDDNVSLQELAALPTDAAGLRSALLDRFHGGGGDLSADRDQWLFEVGSNVVMDMPVSAGVRGAAYRMLAGLPGVRDLGTVQDADGRTGQAVAITEKSRNGTFETRLIIDPASGDPLSRETRAVQPDGTTALSNYGLVVGTGYTDDSPPPVPGPR